MEQRLAVADKKAKHNAKQTEQVKNELSEVISQIVSQVKESNSQNNLKISEIGNYLKGFVTQNIERVEKSFDDVIEDFKDRVNIVNQFKQQQEQINIELISKVNQQSQTFETKGLVRDSHSLEVANLVSKMEFDFKALL